MSAPLITLNATVAEIEDALMDGKSVKTVALDLQEPQQNVYGVYRALVERGEINDPAVARSMPPRRDLTVARQPSMTSQTTGRTGSAPRPVPAPTPPPATPVTGGGAEPTLDALIAAAGRSQSKRTQALGAKLGELAGVVRQRLRDERDAAEKAERENAAREAAVAEVAALEAKLAEARAKLGGKGRGGSGPVRRHRGEAGRLVAEKYSGTKPCEKCGKPDLTTLPGPRGAHMKRCTGGAS
jgi:hypothetical protein